MVAVLTNAENVEVKAFVDTLGHQLVWKAVESHMPRDTEIPHISPLEKARHKTDITPTVPLQRVLHHQHCRRIQTEQLEFPSTPPNTQSPPRPDPVTPFAGRLSSKLTISARKPPAPLPTSFPRPRTHQNSHYLVMVAHFLSARQPSKPRREPRPTKGMCAEAVIWILRLRSATMGA